MIGEPGELLGPDGANERLERVDDERVRLIDVEALLLGTGIEGPGAVDRGETLDVGDSEGVTGVDVGDDTPELDDDEITCLLLDEIVEGLLDPL